MDRRTVGACDHVVGRHGEEVADSAADVALEDEDVSGEFDFLILAEVGVEEDVSLFGGEVVRCAVFL